MHHLSALVFFLISAALPLDALAQSAPTLQGTPLGTSSVSWHWVDAGWPTGYRVIDHTGSSLSGDLAAGTTEWIETGLSNNLSSTSLQRQLVAFSSGFVDTSTPIVRYLLAFPPIFQAANPSSGGSLEVRWLFTGNPEGTNCQVVASTGSAPATNGFSGNHVANGGTIGSLPSPPAYGSVTFSSLDPSGIYYLALRCLNPEGIPTPYIDGGAVAMSGPLFTATALGFSSIAWTWNSVAGATGYRVVDISSNSLSGDLSASTTRWVETSLSANTRYVRSVVAFGVGWSTGSDNFPMYTLADTPANLALSAVYQSSVSLSWSPATNPNGTRFNVSAWNAVTGTTTLTLTGSTASMTGLNVATTYYFSVLALNENNVATPPTAAPSGFYPSIGAPPLSGVALSTYSISWKWTDVPWATGYRIINPAGESLSGDLPANTTSWVETGLATNSYVSNQSLLSLSPLSYQRRLVAFSPVAIATSPPFSRYVLIVPPVFWYMTLQPTNELDIHWIVPPPGIGNWAVVASTGPSADLNGFSGNQIAASGSYGRAAGTTTITSQTSFFGLNPGTTYYIALVGWNLDGVSVPAVDCGTITTSGPPPPASLSGTVLGVSSIAWTWNEVGGEAGYRVTDTSGTSLSGDLAPGTIMWTETGLSTNTVATRYVVSFNSFGASSSTALTRRTFAAPPTHPVFTASTNNSFTLSWATEGNPPGTVFAIYSSTGPSPSSNGFSGNILTLTTGSPTAVGSLASNTSYYVAINARNGDSVGTPVLNVGSLIVPILLAPQLMNTPLGATSIAWQWSDTAGNAGFRVLDAGNFASLSGDLPAHTTQWIETGLSTAAFYNRALVAFLAPQTSTPTVAGTYTLTAPPLLPHPRSVTQAATVDWSSGTNPVSVNYEVDASTGPNPGTNGFSGNHVGLATGLTFTFPDLSTGVRWFFAVRANLYNGPYTDFVDAGSAVTSVLPSTVTLSTSGVGATTINWSWNEIGGETGFRVTNATGVSVSGNLAGGTLQWQETGLLPNTTYSRQVIALDGVPVATSAVATARTLAATPTSPSVTGIGLQSFTVSWSSAGNPLGTVYTVFLSTGASPDTNGLSGNLVTTTTATSLPIPGLSPATTYYLALLATNAAGTPTATAPAGSAATAGLGVAVLSANALSVSSISWCWNDVGGEGGFRVVDASGASLSGNLAAGTTQWVETGLSNNAAAQRQVVAFLGSYVSTSAAVTGYSQAAAPSGVSFQAVYSSSFTVSWSTNANPAGTTYRASAWSVGSTTITITLTSPTTTFASLLSGTSYFLSITALNGSGLETTAALGSTVTLPAASVAVSGGATLAVQLPSGQAQVVIPPGAFAPGVTVTAQVPGILPPPAGAAPLAATGVGVRITASGGAQPQARVGISLPFRPSDVTGLSADRLVLARYDDNRGVWVPLDSKVDAANGTVTGYTDHFSLFSIMATTPAQGLTAPKVYPNPLRPALGHSGVTFANVPAGTRVRIYTLMGELVQDLTASTAGIAFWDGRNQSGASVASGVYFAYLQGEGQSLTLKVAVQR